MASGGLTQEQRDAIQAIRNETLEKIGNEFDKLDLNGDGSIEREELLLVASRYGSGDQMTREKLNEFFTTFDKNSDGIVTRDEWLAWFGQMFDQSLEPYMPQTSDQVLGSPEKVSDNKVADSVVGDSEER